MPAGSKGRARSSAPDAGTRPTIPWKLIAIIVIAVLVIWAVITMAWGSSDEEAIPHDAADTSPKTVTMSFVGDCTFASDESMGGYDSFESVLSREEDTSYFFEDVTDVFEGDDITVVNFEGTFSDSEERSDKVFAFEGDPELVSIISESSVEAASVANNHSHDYGQQSYVDTMEVLGSNGIEPFGYDRIAYIDVDGAKVALIGVNDLLDHDRSRIDMVANIAEARDEGASVIAVYVHWGFELATVPTDSQTELGHAAIDAGADLVVGAHPHVIQGYEVYEGRYIVYSLGNFCFGGVMNPSDTDSLIFQQTFTVYPDGGTVGDDADFIACSITSTSYVNDYRPKIATGYEKTRIEERLELLTEAIDTED